jgi:hypothetical protein
VNVSVNRIDISLGSAGKAGVAALIPAASIFLAIVEPRARIAASAIVGAFALLIVWTLWRGGTVTFPGLTLSGSCQPAEPPTSRVAAPTGRSPRQAAPPAASAGSAGTATGFAILLLAGAAVVWFLAGASHAAASPGASARAQASSPSAVVRAYYADINQRNWPKAWQLAGGQSRDYGTAYQRWADGYRCTVQDQVTRITARGDGLLVLVRAQETGSIVQDYKFSYVVRHGVLTQPRTLSHTGHAPQGCGS